MRRSEERTDGGSVRGMEKRRERGTEIWRDIRPEGRRYGGMEGWRECRKEGRTKGGRREGRKEQTNKQAFVV